MWLAETVYLSIGELQKALDDPASADMASVLVDEEVAGSGLSSDRKKARDARLAEMKAKQAARKTKSKKKDKRGVEDPATEDAYISLEAIADIANAGIESSAPEQKAIYLSLDAFQSKLAAAEDT